MLPRLLVSLLVLIPLILSAMSRGDARREQEITTAASEAAVSDEPANDATETTVDSAGAVRAELDEILLSETHAPGTAAHRAKPRASRAAPRSTAAKSKTTTTVKKRTTTTAAKKPATKSSKPTTTAKKPASPPEGRSQSGIASWYEAAPSGTCAHRSLPKGTRVDVTNLGNGKRTSCVVADRGPYVDGYIIDLSKSNFTDLAPLDDGIIKVTITW